jgi:hypothetical protein
MKSIHKYYKLGRLQIELNFYGSKKKPCKFKIGDEVKCLFGDSGHKFWNELREELIIKKIKYDYHSGLYELQFKNATTNTYFYENDFKKVNHER